MNLGLEYDSAIGKTAIETEVELCQHFVVIGFIIISGKVGFENGSFVLTVSCREIPYGVNFVRKNRDSAFEIGYTAGIRFQDTKPITESKLSTLPRSRIKRKLTQPLLL
jgi:hypothetical protein